MKAHEKTVAIFERQAQEAQDPQVKMFAKQTLPTLKQHLEEAREINRQLTRRVSER